MKKIIYNRFLNEPMNISLLISCLTIVCIQIYYLIDEWINSFLFSMFDYIEKNDFFVAFICAFITLVPSIMSYIFAKIEKKKNSKNDLKEQPTRVFSGVLTKKMMEKEDYILVSNRDLEKGKHNKKPIILDRAAQCDKVLKKIKEIEKSVSEKNNIHFNFLCLTGSSGAGKSIFLQYFFAKNIKKNKAYYFNEYDGSIDLIYKHIMENNFKYIILDQFEKSLENKDIYSIIKKVIRKRGRNVFFVFSFPQDCYDQIFLNLDQIILSDLKKNKRFEYNMGTHFLKCDEYDIFQLKILVNTFLKIGMETINECLSFCEENFMHTGAFYPVLNTRKYPESLVFLCSILTKIKIGITPLVEFSVISYIYELYKDDIDYHIERYIDNIDLIFDLYLNKWIANFKKPDTGKMILQLLCDGAKYNFDDIKCITFEKKDFFEINDNDMMKKEKCYLLNRIFNENKFIHVEDEYSGFKTGVWIVHDYIGNKINDFCFKFLDSTIRQNIEYYKKRQNNNTHFSSVKSESRTKIELLKRYDNYHRKQNALFVNVFTVILMLSSILLSCINGKICNNKLDNVYYIFISLGCFFSTFYMYNIVIHFLRMLKKKFYYPVTIFGTIFVVLCYALPNYWGILLGSEIVVLGLSLFGIRKITVNFAVNYFRSKGIFYIVLGCIVVFFGSLYAVNIVNNVLRMTLATFFLVYVIASVFSHINFIYITSKLGMGNTI